jgi:FlgD Ig-like domain
VHRRPSCFAPSESLRLEKIVTGRARSILSARLMAGFLVVLVALLLASSRSFAQTCTSPALTSGVPVAIGADPSFRSITPTSSRWSTVAVRGTDIFNWDVQALHNTAAFPTCFTGLLAASATTSLDFVVTDWHFRSSTTDYIRASTSGGSGTEAVVEFEQAAYQIQTNMPFNHVTVSSDQLVNTYECQMYAGVRYMIDIAPSASLTGLKMFVFAPVTSGSGWLSRGDRQEELGLVADSGNRLIFTPTVTGVHGIVVANESGTSGGYYIAIGQCPFSSSGLSNNTPFFLPALDDWPAFTPTAHSWGVVAARGDPGYTYLVEVTPFPRLDVVPFPICSDSVLASQYSGLATHLVTGDFRSLPLRLYTVRASLTGDYKTSSAGYVEFETGADSITVNSPPVFVSPPVHNVIDAWSLRLSTGSSYDFHLTQNGGTAIYKLLLFKNPSPGSGYWASRPDAVFETTGANNYKPLASDVYGLVVVNDNGGTGTYYLSVTSSLVAVEPGHDVPAVSRIRSATPNPAFAGAHIGFELAVAGRAALTIRDVTGRVVATVPLGIQPAGLGTAHWDGRSTDGRRVPAGVYLVTLSIEGRSAEGRKLVVLE